MPYPLSRRLRGTCLAAALAAASLPAAAAEPPLTLSQAQRIAAERSRQLEAQSLGVGAARDMAVAAGQLPDPVLSFGVDNLPIEGSMRFNISAEPMTMRRIELMQELPSKAKRELRAERFEKEALKGLAEQEAVRATIHRDTAIAWLDAWYAVAMAQVLAEQRLRGLQEAQGAEAEYRAGRGSQADVLMAHANLAMLDDRAAELERRVRTSRTMLARWAGADGERPLAEKPDIHAVSLEIHGLDEQLSRHPEISLLARQEEMAVAEARLARANKKPDWSVQLMYNIRGSAFGDMVSVGVSVPLPWDQPRRQDRELAAKLAAVGQAQAQREEALRQHVAEVRNMFHEWESNRTRLVRYEREIVPLATARADASLAAYRGGKSAVGEVLAARRAELEARLQALQLEAETARIWAQLNFLVVEAPK
jgi:outer membrane protein TolC